MVLTGLLGAAFLGWFSYVLSPDVRVLSAHLFGRLGAYSVVHHYLHDDDSTVYVAAREILVEAGADAVPTLLEGLSDAEAERRLMDLSILSRIGKPAGVTLPKLAELALRDNDAAVRVAAVSMLPSFSKEDRAVFQTMVDALHDSAPSVRIAASGALGELGIRARDAIPDLAKNLHGDRDAHVRLAIVQALANIGPDARSLKALVHALREDTDPDVRAEACESLGAFGPKAEDAVMALADGLKDKNARVRQESAEALGNIGPKARAAIPRLREALRDPVERVANEAKSALARIGE